MTLKDLQNKKIALLGLGVENYALLKFLLARKVNCQITICDKRSTKELGDKYKEIATSASTPPRNDKVIGWQLGQEYNQKLERYDILFRSPGWPLFCSGIVKAQKLNHKIIVTSPMRLFFDLCPTKNIIGVTGTKGKGTTASLIYDVLKENFKTHPALSSASWRISRGESSITASTPLPPSPPAGGYGRASKRGITPKVWLGGNIGTAPFEFLSKIKAGDWVVLELSSFQLEDLTKSPKIAVLTNFTPEHLVPADPHNPNFHRNLVNYFESKLNICLWQKNSDYFVINEKLRERIKNYELRIKNKIKSRRIYFSKSSLSSNLVGEHNKENIGAAETVAKIVGIKKDIIAKAVRNFKGLEHRIELAGELRGVKYFDDSFATTPESAIIALKSFSAPVILLAGGADKGADFKNFAKEIKQRVKFVCLLKGKATPRLQKETLRAGFAKKNVKEFTGMKTAVQMAVKQAVPGDIVLLSTACASFGMFTNYKERGDLFKKIVRNL